VSEFGTEANLSLTVEQRELRRVRSEIEDALSDVRLGIGGQGGARGAAAVPDGGAASGRERRRRRREFRWARQRTSDLEDAVVYLEEIEDKVGEGGGSGIFSSITDIGGDVAGEALGGLSGAIATGIGSAVGTVVGDAISSETVSVEDVGPLDVDGRRFSIQKPEWAPLNVGPAPDWVPLELMHPEWAPIDVNDPGALKVDDPSPLGVEDVDPLPVDRTPIPIESPTGTTNIRVGAGSGDGKLPDDIPEVYNPPGILEATRENAQQGGEILPIAGHLAGGLFGLGAGIGANLPGSAAQDRAAQSRRDRRNALLEEAARGGGGAGNVSITVDQQNDVSVGGIDVDAELEYSNLDRELDRLEDDILDEVEDRIETAINELERDIRRGRR
jgi:hypothetical protein